MGVWLVGVDTGGTFTDLIAVEQNTGELRRAKVPSVSSDPSAAVLDAMDKLFAEGIDPADISLFVHGTTVATNALLEGKGVRTGLLITQGFRAVYEARGWSQPRGSDLLDTFYQKPPLLASQWLTEEVRERLDYRGEVVTALDEWRLSIFGTHMYMLYMPNRHHTRATLAFIEFMLDRSRKAGRGRLLPGTH